MGTENFAEKLAERATLKVLEKKQELYKRGADADYLYFLFKGSCELLDHDNKVIEVIEKNQSLGESPLLDARPRYAVSARALEQTDIAEVKYSDFLEIAEDKEIWKRLFQKVTNRLNQRREQDAKRPQVIVAVHGILTFAEWQPKLKAAFKEAGLDIALTNFGLFGLIKFLMPGKYFREKMIDQVKTQLEAVQKEMRGKNLDAKISILAHSFGSYIVAEMIASKPGVSVHRVVFCGSIVPYNHPFLHQIGNRITDCVVNDIGTSDVWPVLANSVTTGYGNTGTYGFRCHPKVTDRWFKGLGHSDFFKDVEFCKKNWIPFFKQGAEWLDSDDAKRWPALLEKEEEGKTREQGPVKKKVKKILSSSVYWVSLVKFKVVVPIVGLVWLWWNWDYIVTQLCKLS